MDIKAPVFTSLPSYCFLRLRTSSACKRRAKSLVPWTDSRHKKPTDQTKMQQEDQKTKSDVEEVSEPCRPLQVIGSGLMRTGTTSLKCALTHLLQGPCLHMSTLVHELREPALRGWVETFELRRCGPQARKQLADKLVANLRGFASAVDYPTCVFYRELMKIYPEAKVILTVRDADDWVASCRATIMSKDMLRKPTPGRRLVHWFNNTSSLLDLHEDMFSCTLGKDFLPASDEELKQAYLRWNAEVIARVPKERLLVFKAEDGWKPLCDFLGLEEPVGLEYPHANRRTEMAEVLNAQIKKGHQLNCLILLLAGGMLLLSAVMFCLKRD